MFINYSAESGDTTLGKLADLLKDRPIGSVFLLQNNGKQYVRHSMISRRTFYPAANFRITYLQINYHACF